jgi:hypothetical protein
MPSNLTMEKQPATGSPPYSRILQLPERSLSEARRPPLPSVPAIDEWYKNAAQIASFFHQLNPQSWGLEEMKKMMHHHLKITTSEVLSCLHGGNGAKAYVGIHRQAMEMADELSAGILRQFGGTRVHADT